MKQGTLTSLIQLKKKITVATATHSSINTIAATQIESAAISGYMMNRFQFGIFLRSNAKTVLAST